MTKYNKKKIFPSLFSLQSLEQIEQGILGGSKQWLHLAPSYPISPQN
jgi:hypothetical protein